MASAIAGFSANLIRNCRFLARRSIFTQSLTSQRCRAIYSVRQSAFLAASWTDRKYLHTSPVTYGLEEFFDDKDTLGQETVKCGRPWNMDELRIKSNSDLHKLWYILLKERNVLMTMEHEYRQQSELFPSPERIHKVEESMENILEVVKERNTAYNLLETGETGLPGKSQDIDALGRPTIRHHMEYPFPAFMHINNRRKALLGRWTIPYLRRWREKVNNKRYASYMRKLKEARRLKEKFPDADIDFPEKPVYMEEMEASEMHSTFEKRDRYRS